MGRGMGKGEGEGEKAPELTMDELILISDVEDETLVTKK